MNLASQLMTIKNSLIFVAVSVTAVFLFQTIVIWTDIVVILGSVFIKSFDKLYVIAGLYTHPLQYTPLSNYIMVLFISGLIGLQMVQYVYIRATRKQAINGRKIPKTKTTILSGVLTSLGMGCAACGSLVLISILSTFGVSLSVTLVSWLSTIFLSVAVGVLLFTNYKLYKQAKNPLVCNIVYN